MATEIQSISKEALPPLKETVQLNLHKDPQNLNRIVEAHSGGMLRNAIKNASKLTSSTSTVSKPSDPSSPSPKPAAAVGSFFDSDKSSSNLLEESLRSNKGRAMTDATRAEMTHLLLEAVSKCSRQKMRYILMSLRQKGGIDSYMTYGDLTKILQDNGLIIPSIASSLIQASCSDQLGIDSEKVWNLLMGVHGQSDRDSVRARKGMHLRTPVISVFADHGGDREILERMEAQFLAAPADSTFDFTAFKNAVLALDKSRQGYVANTQLLKVCRELGLPVKPDLLKSLLIRCDDDNNGKISHRELFVLVDKAFENAIRANPKLFAKTEEHPHGTRKKTDAGRLLEDGVVNVVRSQLNRANSVDRQSVQDGDEGPQSDAITDISPDFKTRKTSVAANSVVSFGSDDNPTKPKGRLGKMKGLLGRGRKGNQPGESLGVPNSDANSDVISTASSIFSTISRFTSGTQRADLATGANGLAEKPIHPVVRKIGGHKLIFWPPDEYFDTVTPKIRLPSLEWVYGYSGFNHRNNVHFMSGSATLVYFVGQIVVLYDINSDSQRHYCEHDSQIQALVLTKDCLVAASGQSQVTADAGAQIRIWTTDKLSTLHVLTSQNPNGSILQNSISAMCFSREDDALIAIDEGKPRSLSVWAVDVGQLLVAKPCTESPVVCGIVALRTSTKDPWYIIYGRGLMEVWRIVPVEKRIDFVRQCIFGQIPKPTIVTCVIESVHTNSDDRSSVLSGDSDGNVILWTEEMRPQTILQKGSKVPVFSLAFLSPSYLTIGSRDGLITALKMVADHPITKGKLPEQYGGIRMIVPLLESDGASVVTSSSVVIGTTANSLVRWNFIMDNNEVDAEKHDLSVITAGHFDDVDCLSTFVQLDKSGWAITAGLDGNINCFDLAHHKASWRHFLKDSMVTAIDCYQPFLAVGTSDAKLKLFQLVDTELTLILQANVGKIKVTCAKFSPDGSRLAVASQESEVYVYKFSDGNDTNISIIGKFDKHDYPVVSIDWSRNPARDNHYVIHSNSYEFENFLWDAENMDYLEEAHFYRNVKWFSASCVMGFPAATSVTSENALDSHIVCTDVTPTFDMVAAVLADQKGQLGLYSFPNATAAVVKQMQPTYSSCVHSLRFCYVNNKLYLLCVHGQDGSISQWSLR